MLDELNERISHRPDRYLSEMQHDEWRIKSGGEINGLKCLSDRALALLGVGRRKLVTIRRCAQNFDGEGTEIMQAGEAHLAGVKHLLNSRHERQSDAVAKLDMIESKFFDFA